MADPRDSADDRSTEPEPVAEVAAEPASDERRAEQDHVVKSAGRGVAFITGAKLYFIAAGYAVQFLLPGLLGSPEAYGTYSTVLTLVSIVNNVLVAGTIQTISKLVSEREEEAAAIVRRGLAYQLALGVVLAGAFAGSSGWVAHDVLLDGRLAPMLAVVSIVLLSYSVYAALVGSLNGRRLFSRQAALDLVFSTLRTCGILVPAALGLGALGSVSGFAAAAVVILCIALVVVGAGRSGAAAPSLRRYAGLALPLLAYQSLINVMMQIDLPVLRRYAAIAAIDAGQSAEVAAETGARLAGYFRAAQSFAFIPYQLIIPVTFVVFPLVSRATASDDAETAKTYVRGALRFSLLVLLGIAAPLIGGAEGALRFVFPPEYGMAAPALQLLACAQVVFALFVIEATILGGSGRVRAAALIALAGVAVLLPSGALLVSRVGVGGGGVAAMEAAATATGLGTTTALVIVTVYLHRTLGASFAPLTVARTVAAAAAAVLTTAFLLRPSSKVMSLGAMIAGGVVYIVVLVVTREIGRADIERFTRRRREPDKDRR